MAFPNPFARDTEGQQRNISAYKVLTILSWLLQFVYTIYTSISYNHRGWFGHNHGNFAATPFSLNGIFVEIFWIVLYVMQIVYIWHLFSNRDHFVNPAASVGSHFILYNFLQFLWVFCWTRGGLYLVALIILIINFFNLLSLYLRHATSPRLIHLATTAMPLTFNFFMIYWNGAVVVHAHDHLVARILANIAIWGVLVYALFFLVAFKDYYVGFTTSYLAFALAVGQLGTKAIALQWPFAFTIAGLTFIASALAAFPGIFGENTGLEGSGRRGERAPLLQEDA